MRSADLHGATAVERYTLSDSAFARLEQDRPSLMIWLMHNLLHSTRAIDRLRPQDGGADEWVHCHAAEPAASRQVSADGGAGRGVSGDWRGADPCD